MYIVLLQLQQKVSHMHTQHRCTIFIKSTAVAIIMLCVQLTLVILHIKVTLKDLSQINILFSYIYPLCSTCHTQQPYVRLCQHTITCMPACKCQWEKTCLSVTIHEWRWLDVHVICFLLCQIYLLVGVLCIFLHIMWTCWIYVGECTLYV